MNIHKLLTAASVGVAVMLGTASAALSVELLTNGDFETGTFAGWTVTDQVGGSGTWSIDTPGTTTPLSGFPTSAAGGMPHGSFYAVSDQGGPGTHVLTQSFIVAAGTKVHLSFDLFVNDTSGAGPIFNPAGLDYTASPNQHARVDILTGAATPFDTGAGVVGNLYLGIDPFISNPNPFTSYTFDISSIVAGGGTYQVRFAEVDNQGFFHAGVDNVSIQVPEPGTLALFGLGLAGLGIARRRKAV